MNTEQTSKNIFTYKSLSNSGRLIVVYKNIDFGGDSSSKKRIWQLSKEINCNQSNNHISGHGHNMHSRLC